MKTIFDSVLIGFLGLGGIEVIIILLIVLVMLVGIPVLSYRLGWKSGYNAGKADALDKKISQNI